MTKQLDSTDVVLLRELQADARQTNRALAKKAALAPSTSLARIRDLEEREVIAGYHAEVDLAALGRGLQALIFVRLQPKSQEVVTSFVDHVWALPETIAVHLITGVEDAVIHVALRDTDALRTLIIDRISAYPGVLDERTSLLFTHRRRHVIEPL